jgi:hypothetical protein
VPTELVLVTVLFGATTVIAAVVLGCYFLDCKAD